MPISAAIVISSRSYHYPGFLNATHLPRFGNSDTHSVNGLSEQQSAQHDESVLCYSIERGSRVARDTSWSLEQICFIIDRISEQHHRLYLLEDEYEDL